VGILLNCANGPVCWLPVGYGSDSHSDYCTYSCLAGNSFVGREKAKWKALFKWGFPLPIEMSLASMSPEVDPIS